MLVEQNTTKIECVKKENNDKKHPHLSSLTNKSKTRVNQCIKSDNCKERLYSQGNYIVRILNNQ